MQKTLAFVAVIAFVVIQAAADCGDRILEDGEECEFSGGISGNECCDNCKLRPAGTLCGLAGALCPGAGACDGINGGCQDFECHTCGDGNVQGLEECDPPGGCCMNNCRLMDGCVEVCPECAKSWDPLMTPDGTVCDMAACAYNERCSYTAGMVCVLDESCANNCPACIPEGTEQPTNRCGGLCNSPACQDCAPICTCSKSWDQAYDGCGNPCDNDACAYNERCSYSAGKVCVPDESCANNCPACIPEGTEQPSNGCAGRCNSPIC